jgi:hypothetical protein
MGMGRGQGTPGVLRTAAARTAGGLAGTRPRLEVISDTGETDSADFVAGLVEALTPDPDHEGYHADIRSQIERSDEYARVVISVPSAQPLLLPTDEGIVAGYVAAIAAGEAIDPVVFVEEFGVPDADLSMLDGNHRLKAAFLGGLDGAEAYVPSDWLL